MSNNYQPLITRKMSAVTENLVEDTCSDARCGMTIWVEKDMKEAGQKSRCMACILRDKLAHGIIR